eukprot:15475567-Alexandrium_andersonii.AAC.1
MRRALHLHALLSDLGFATPEDLRRLLTSDFDAAVRRLWRWVAPWHFTSVEGDAAFHDEPAAMDALREAPL